MLDRVRLEAEELKSVFPSLGNSYVGGEGGESPRVMIVGDVPSAQAEMAGRPFAGHLGVVLRQLIGLAGLEFSDCHFTNLLKYRSPGGRRPNYAEASAFRNVLKTEWVSVGRPALIVAIDPAAYIAISGTRVTGTGKYARVTNAARITLLHNPTMGLQNPELREKIEKEWKRLQVP